MKRCVACGGFFDGEHCPNDHSWIEEYTPPALPGTFLPTPRRDAVGQFYTWQVGGEEHPALIVEIDGGLATIAIFGRGDPGHVHTRVVPLIELVAKDKP